MGMLTKLINVLIIILSLTLGFFFMFVGILKLTPAVKEKLLPSSSCHKLLQVHLNVVFSLNSK